MQEISTANTRSQWKRSLFLGAALFIISVLLYAHFYWALIELWWENEDYGHGLITIPLVILLLWKRRYTFALDSPTGSLWGSVVLAPILLCWWLAYLLDIKSLLLPSLTAMTLCLAWIAFGSQIMKKSWIAIGLILMSIPIWDPLRVLLQYITLHVANSWFILLGYPTLINGTTVTLPGGAFVVEPGCSGLRFFLAALYLAWVYLALNPLDLRRSAILISIVLSLAIVLNWIRVVVVMHVGNATLMQDPLVRNHAFLGWLMFVAVVPLTLVKASARLTHSTSTPFTVFATNRPAVLQHRFTQWLAPMIGVVLLIVASVSANLLKTGRPSNEPILKLNSLAAPRDWVEEMDRTATWKPIYIGADAELMQCFASGDNVVQVYIAYYKHQDQGKELVYYKNSPYGDEDDFASEDFVVPMADREMLDVNKVITRDRLGKGRMIFYWYNVAGINTNSEIMAKFLHIKNLVGFGHGSAVIAISKTYSAGQERQAEDLLRSFIQGLKPAFVRMFDTEQ